MDHSPFCKIQTSTCWVILLWNMLAVHVDIYILTFHRSYFKIWQRKMLLNAAFFSLDFSHSILITQRGLKIFCTSSSKVFDNDIADFTPCTVGRVCLKSIYVEIIFLSLVLYKCDCLSFFYSEESFIFWPPRNIWIAVLTRETMDLSSCSWTLCTDSGFSF